MQIQVHRTICRVPVRSVLCKRCGRERSATDAARERELSERAAGDAAAASPSSGRNAPLKVMNPVSAARHGNRQDFCHGPTVRRSDSARLFRAVQRRVTAGSWHHLDWSPQMPSYVAPMARLLDSRPPHAISRHSVTERPSTARSVGTANRGGPWHRGYLSGWDPGPVPQRRSQAGSLELRGHGSFQWSTKAIRSPQAPRQVRHRSLSVAAPGTPWIGDVSTVDDDRTSRKSAIGGVRRDPARPNLRLESRLFSSHWKCTDER